MDNVLDLCKDACESCRSAVTRVYREMRSSGETDLVAFRASARVLALRHPERDSTEIHRLASEWISEELRNVRPIFDA